MIGEIAMAVVFLVACVIGIFSATARARSDLRMAELERRISRHESLSKRPKLEIVRDKRPTPKATKAAKRV